MLEGILFTLVILASNRQEGIEVINGGCRRKKFLFTTKDFMRNVKLFLRRTAYNKRNQRNNFITDNEKKVGIPIVYINE